MKKKRHSPDELKAYIIKVVKGGMMNMGLSGRLGKLLVFKQYKGRTLITKYPDRSRVVLSEKQLAHRERFRAANTWAHMHKHEYQDVKREKWETTYLYALKVFFKSGLGVQDVERELAEERNQTKKEGKINVFMGLWFLIGSGVGEGMKSLPQIASVINENEVVRDVETNNYAPLQKGKEGYWRSYT